MKNNDRPQVCKRENCNNELPFRYKGVPKQFCSPECRKLYHGLSLTAKDMERMEKKKTSTYF
jgi:hypothetical protein